MPNPLQVDTVLNLGIVGSPSDYVHRAGRVGRVGQRSRGQVISVLQPSEVSELLDLGTALQFEPRERSMSQPMPLTTEMDQEDAVQALSDIYNLYD